MGELTFPQNFNFCNTLKITKMKHEIKKTYSEDKLFADIKKLICNKFDFSFSIDENLALNLSYNKGAGSAKLMLDNLQMGAFAFVMFLNEHANRTAGTIHENFYLTIFPGEGKQVKSYTKTKDFIYFSSDNWKQIEGNEIDFSDVHLQRGQIVLTDRFPGVQFVSHKAISNKSVSILHRGNLVTTGRHEEKDKIQASIDALGAILLDESELLDEVNRLIDKGILQGYGYIDSEGQAVEENVQEEAKIEAEIENTQVAEVVQEIKETAEEKQAADAALLKQVEKIAAEVKNGYTLENKVIWFNYFSFMVTDSKDVDKLPGRLVTLHEFPGTILVVHQEIEGTRISLLYKNQLFYFIDLKGGGNEVDKAIKQIKEKGLETIMKMAEESLTDL